MTARIDGTVRLAIDAGKIPGCVVAIGRHDGVLFERAYGSRALRPAIDAMTLDTVFDLASLTKPLATAFSVLTLAQRGSVDLDAPLRTYLPELGSAGRGTVRQALLHTAGFVADTPIRDFEAGPAEALRRIAARPLRDEPGRAERYSDVGFFVLGELVRRVSGEDLGTFSRDAVFAPLGLRETSFLPAESLRARAAPTELVDGRWLRGEVHDPRARALGGVAGHAGLFSTADDVARFAESLLPGATTPLLDPVHRRAFLAPHDVPGGVRALGWDVRSPYSSNRGAALSPRAFGHGGYTGTSLWIDPEKDLFVIVLSNRVHPDGRGEVNPLAGAIADLAASAVGPDEPRLAPPCESGTSASPRAPERSSVARLPVETGLDVLVAERFARLRGARVGLLTHLAGASSSGARAVDLLASAPDVKLVALFSPEHGLGSDVDARVGDARDEATGLPIYSLYGEHLAPTDAQLEGIDTLVVDLQDVGVRFFTYASTLHRAMQVAARRGVRVVVLDRPNPLDGEHVEGPPLVGPRSFANHAELPVRHGMTMGELAVMLDADEHLGTALEVVRMRGWARDMRWGATGLSWTPPSPSLRTPEEAALYPGVALLEATNVSVGRGTDSPFEVVGAPWIDAETFAAAAGEALTGAGVRGVRIAPTSFTPTSSRYAHQLCHGVSIELTDTGSLSPVTLGLALAFALHGSYPSRWERSKLAPLLGYPPALAAIEQGAGPLVVASSWEGPLRDFARKRSKYLLYPSRTCP